MKKSALKILSLLLVFVFCTLCLAGCSTNNVNSTSTDTDSAYSFTQNIGGYEQENITSAELTDKSGESVTFSEGEHPTVLFTMEDGSTFTIELYPEYAPETCANFLNLVNEGFYSGLTFRRIIDGFMAQGGDPLGTGNGGSSSKIHGEFSSNGFTQNTLKHERGVVSMARSKLPDSASSQFFICYGDASWLDGQYAAFGKVIDGMETVDSFLEIERTYGNDNALSKPVTPIVISSAVQIDG